MKGWYFDFAFTCMKLSLAEMRSDSCHSLTIIPAGSFGSARRGRQTLDSGGHLARRSN
jgi:hypothetical protein